jgi:hypothetical protein
MRPDIFADSPRAVAPVHWRHRFEGTYCWCPSAAGRVPSRTCFSVPRLRATAALTLGIASGPNGRSSADEGSSSTSLVSRPASRRLEQVAAGGVEGADLSFDGEPARRREFGDLESFLAAAGDGAGLPVGGTHPGWPGRGLDGARDRVVPRRDVAEVGEVREDLIRGPGDRDGVLECCHRGLRCQLSSSRWAAAGSWAGSTTRPGCCCASARTLCELSASRRRLPTPGSWPRRRISAP